MNHKLPRVALAVVLGLACGAASAQLNVVKAGAILYQTNSKTDGINGIGFPPGADAKTGDATTLLATYERLVTPNFGVELVIGVPPTIKANAAGSVAALGDDILSAKNVAPTLLFNYHFGDPGATFRPYVGAGINYTKFTNVKSRLASSVELGDSTGLAVQAGFDYAFSKEWGLFASIAKVKVKSKLVAVAFDVTPLTTTIDFRPTTYSIGVSYKF
jgi:outer membrane protein